MRAVSPVFWALLLTSGAADAMNNGAARLPPLGCVARCTNPTQTGVCGAIVWRMRARGCGSAAPSSARCSCSILTRLTLSAAVPPLRWSQWNAFGMRFNGTLFREVAQAMKDNGLQAAGYTLLNVGGNGHAVNGSNDPAHSSGTAIDHSGKPLNCTAAKGCFTAVRNSTGHYQISAARFPGPGSTPECLNDTTLAACMELGGGGSATAQIVTPRSAAARTAMGGCVSWRMN